VRSVDKPGDARFQPPTVGVDSTLIARVRGDRVVKVGTLAPAAEADGSSCAALMFVYAG
jgi:hypothetical protein